MDTQEAFVATTVYHIDARGERYNCLFLYRDGKLGQSMSQMLKYQTAAMRAVYTLTTHVNKLGDYQHFVNVLRRRAGYYVW